MTSAAKTPPDAERLLSEFRKPFPESTHAWKDPVSDGFTVAGLVRSYTGMGLEPYQFVVDYGIEWPGAARPAWCTPGPLRHCFANAANLALTHAHGGYARLTYVEGFASRAYPLPVLHAWLVLDDGTVVDPTWPDAEQCSYFGVSFTASDLRRELLRTRHYGLLDYGRGPNRTFITAQRAKRGPPR